MLTGYYQKSKKTFLKNAPERYQGLSEEEKKRQYVREWLEIFLKKKTIKKRNKEFENIKIF